MKKRITNTAFAFSLLILVSMALQSVHSLRHLTDFLSEKKCDHHYAVNKTVISHQHHQLDHCFSCEFTFSTFLDANLQQFRFAKAAFFSKYTIFYSSEIAFYFNGSLFQLRAPPGYNV